MAEIAPERVLSDRYESLAFDLDDGEKGHFLSGWQCENPFCAPLLSSVKERAATLDHRKYTFFDDDEGLTDRIRRLHEAMDGAAPPAVLCGVGSTPLLFAFVSYLRRLGIERVHVMPPVYFTVHTALELYGIRVLAAASRHTYELDFSLELPDAPQSVLLMSDPVWYAGIPVAEETVERVREWQHRTRSLVFVDGSFQYLPWDGERRELTATLDPALTFRLVCPSKQLCVHGYRFAYLLAPDDHLRKLAWTYANICGAVGADSIAFAHEAIAAVADGTLPRRLTQVAARRHRRLREAGVLRSTLRPSCGYTVFEQLDVELPADYTVIDGTYFDQPRYDGYVKINLLSPSIPLLGRSLTEA